MSLLSRLFGKQSFDDTIGNTLAPVLEGLRHEMRGLPFETLATDMLLLGYVHGCAQGAAKAAGATDGAQIVGTIQAAFQTLFGQKPGLLLWAQSNAFVPVPRDDKWEWAMGFEFGEADTLSFARRLTEAGSAPFPNRLSEHLQSRRQH